MKRRHRRSTHHDHPSSTVWESEVLAEAPGAERKKEISTAWILLGLGVLALMILFAFSAERDRKLELQVGRPIAAPPAVR